MSSDEESDDVQEPQPEEPPEISDTPLTPPAKPPPPPSKPPAKPPSKPPAKPPAPPVKKKPVTKQPTLVPTNKKPTPVVNKDRLLVFHGAKYYTVDPKNISHRGIQPLELENGATMGKLAASKVASTWAKMGLRCANIWVLTCGDKCGFYVTMTTPAESDDAQILRHVHASVAKEIQSHFHSSWTNPDKRLRLKAILDAKITPSQISPPSAGWNVTLTASVSSVFVRAPPPLHQVAAPAPVAKRPRSDDFEDGGDPSSKFLKDRRVFEQCVISSDSVVVPYTFFRELIDAYAQSKR